ncbi:uncharacterized protein [Arachis hypogaea]|uniref:uncharacterized protein isoform X2 n=1 Tax=Arachis hypogaea TaxID=3818 RepID=UPI003B21556A
MGERADEAAFAAEKPRCRRRKILPLSSPESWSSSPPEVVTGAAAKPVRRLPLFWFCHSFFVRSTFEAWKVEKVFSNISWSVIFSPHNFIREVIRNIAELYSFMDLKFCKRKCVHSYRA